MESPRRMYGPAFHRFLPNNKHDKLEKKLSSLNGKISFWFERRGIIVDNLIKYDNKKRLVNENVILKQGILDGGPLFGQMTLNEVSSEVLQVLQNNIIGDPLYISLGKKIVKEITEHSTVLINIIRELYRQYWIRSIKHWDSRIQSLGSYCKSELSLEYSLDNGQTWHNFVPDAERNEVHLDVMISFDFSDFISKNDWIKIKALFKKDFRPSIASNFLTQAHETCDKGDLKKAFIEAVTALEMALEYKINENPKLISSILDSIQSFKALTLKSQFSIIALLCDNFNSNDIENSIEAIKIRNSIVHDGYSPKESDETILYSLLTSISRIIDEQVTKFPSSNPGNALQSVESWENSRKKVKN